MTTTETAGSGSATLGTVGPELGPDDWPRRAPGLALLGEYRDSGYTEPQYLARRAYGQMVQLSALLYAILDAVDGSRDAAASRRRSAGRPGEHWVAATSGI